MIFIGGISQGRKVLNFHGAVVICDSCGAYGRYQVFMTYMYFSFFFIPLFKWGKKYFVQMSCCDAVYELNPETGAAIARGMDVEIRKEDLNLVRQGRGNPYDHSQVSVDNAAAVCPHCGYQFQNDEFEYCPKCGKRL
ncbi:zinc ribbon domain-containing protein [Clostridium sp. AM58-1XD]|uniref:zinc ribbon domain-containing protein n=1 Tax=Clostridium sp. AM58-1XD TaxID=2292307 RepID=UPI000E496BFD|nr:zinc ribbon domain-containing protein [Clostridium sp. AM58-1XD]RGZ00088.1 zinc-ribbon domain-containing protein [Clostridium sp. AM58-1XD]